MAAPRFLHDINSNGDIACSSVPDEPDLDTEIGEKGPHDGSHTEIVWQNIKCGWSDEVEDHRKGISVPHSLFSSPLTTNSAPEKK